jgi:hypothetical protein
LVEGVDKGDFDGIWCEVREGVIGRELMAFTVDKVAASLLTPKPIQEVVVVLGARMVAILARWCGYARLNKRLKAFDLRLEGGLPVESCDGSLDPFRPALICLLGQSNGTSPR